MSEDDYHPPRSEPWAAPSPPAAHAEVLAEELPLRCEAVGGMIRIVIGVNVLAFAAGQNADLWDGESDQPAVKITDAALFAEAVSDAINEEGETGETRLTRMLDDAICHAVENGCEGVDYGDE